jgi:nitrate/nitrite-specific signal transduction histidine kinase
MKISQKFLISVVVVTGIFTGVFLVNTKIVQRIRDFTIKQRQESTESIKEALTAENALKSEISLFKDIILFKHQDSQIQYFQNKFLASLIRLENFRHNSREINLIRHQHESLVQMVTHLTQEQITHSNLAESRKYFQAINSFDNDIEFNLNNLIDKAYKQELLVDKRTEDLYQLQRIVPLIVLGAIIILFLAKFLILWTPIIISLKKLQKGTTEIAAGNFNYRLNISTGDEVETLAQAFNHMAIK